MNGVKVARSQGMYLQGGRENLILDCGPPHCGGNISYFGMRPHFTMTTLRESSGVIWGYYGLYFFSRVQSSSTAGAMLDRPWLF